MKVNVFLFLGLAAVFGNCPLMAQMVTGSKIPGYYETLNLPSSAEKVAYRAVNIGSSVRANILWPGDTLILTAQVENVTSELLTATGHIEIIRFATQGVPGDIWKPKMVRLALEEKIPVSVEIPKQGWTNIVIAPKIPEIKGAYALVMDLGDAGRTFVGSVGRVFKPVAEQAQYPQLCTDITHPGALARLGVAPNRIGFSYKPTTDPDFEAWYEKATQTLREYRTEKLPVTIEIGAGDSFHANQPLGRARPHLDADGNFLNTKSDMAWLPSYDADFKVFVKRVIRDFGWPRGTINGIMLWNEPWQGISISGWGADIPRYREIFTVLCEATREVCQEENLDVLIGGCDSSTNTMDYLFPSSNDEWLDYLDFCSIHYQGMFPPSTYKPWRDRQHKNGRMRTWDTESWVANTDDRVATVMAVNLAIGYDRAVGVFQGNVINGENYWNVTTYRTAEGKTVRDNIIGVWPVAPALSAAMEFIGPRKFDRLAYGMGLPWAMVFHGRLDAKGVEDAEDGTIIVAGDIGEEFGAENVALRTARGLREKENKRELIEKLSTMRGDDPARPSLMEQFTTGECLQDASMTLTVKKNGGSDAFALYDFYGNRVPSEKGKIVVPLDGRGFFLRGNGKKGSFAALARAIDGARIEGIEPVAVVCRDLLKPIDQNPDLRVTLHNVLNRPVKGTLTLNLHGLTLEKATHTVKIAPHTSIEVSAKIVGGTVAANNVYPLSLVFDAGKDGVARHVEDMHVNWIAKRSITVDGHLEDWKNLPPQIVRETSVGPTFTEAAWNPYTSFPTNVTGGRAEGDVAYDEHYFYFAARVADSTPHEGMQRYATRDEDLPFYPQTSYVHRVNAATGKPNTNFIRRDDPPGDEDVTLVWPEGVRRFSYRERPELPNGSAVRRDNIQIAFNVLPVEEKMWYPHSPGTFPRFTTWATTDYEYALNPVAERFGGGVEIWRLQYPGMPHKMFFPRQPKSPLDGPVAEGKLAIRHDGNTRFVEAAIPWEEIPAVKKALDENRTAKFSFRVNDDKGTGCMELSRYRSVAKRSGNGTAFSPDWVEHWDNELEFAFGK
jgi:hypothetical protein